jgi:hypothetical protein
VEVVSSRPAARACFVRADGTGGAMEEDLSVRYLGAHELRRAA